MRLRSLWQTPSDTLSPGRRCSVLRRYVWYVEYSYDLNSIALGVPVHAGCVRWLNARYVLAR